MTLADDGSSSYIASTHLRVGDEEMVKFPLLSNVEKGSAVVVTLDASPVLPVLWQQHANCDVRLSFRPCGNHKSLSFSHRVGIKT